MNSLRRVLDGVDTVSNWSGKAVAHLVLVMIFITLWEVVARYVFNNPTRWALETAQLMFGAYFILLGAYALRWKSHIAMDLLYARWSPRKKAMIDVITSLLFFFFIVSLLYFGGDFAWDSITKLEHSSTIWNPPIYPVKLCIPLAAFLVLLQGTAKFIRDLNMVIKGEEL
jgi:TRAP-type mannitol/chloroaromatic compound transport system permease small subunit